MPHPKKSNKICRARVRCHCLCYKPFVKLGKNIINAILKRRLPGVSANAVAISGPYKDLPVGGVWEGNRLLSTPV